MIKLLTLIVFIASSSVYAEGMGLGSIPTSLGGGTILTEDQRYSQEMRLQNELLGTKASLQDCKKQINDWVTMSEMKKDHDCTLSTDRTEFSCPDGKVYKLVQSQNQSSRGILEKTNQFDEGQISQRPSSKSVQK